DEARRFCTAVVLRCRRLAAGWRITISCGGHPPPIRGSSRGTELVGRPGTLLGMLADVELHDVDVLVDDASVLVAYTDGVSEARRDRQLFGDERVRTLVDR